MVVEAKRNLAQATKYMADAEATELGSQLDYYMQQVDRLITIAGQQQQSLDQRTQQSVREI